MICFATSLSSLKLLEIILQEANNLFETEDDLLFVNLFGFALLHVWVVVNNFLFFNWWDLLLLIISYIRFEIDNGWGDWNFRLIESLFRLAFICFRFIWGHVVTKIRVYLGHWPNRWGNVRILWFHFLEIALKRCLQALSFSVYFGLSLCQFIVESAVIFFELLDHVFVLLALFIHILFIFIEFFVQLD